MLETLPDVLFLLNWAFAGTATPPCLDAADVDANGILFGLTDAVYFLAAAFTPGSPEIPDPSPDCGEGAIILGCDTQLSCP